MSTFRERVLEFWKWFPTQTSDIKSAFTTEDPGAALAEFRESVREKVGGLSWVFGPGAEEGGHSFTVSGEGQKPKQLLSQFWLENAKPVPGWDFHASRQPSDPETLQQMQIQVGENVVDMDTVLIATNIDEENEQVDIVAWHPAFENLPDNNRFQILFLLLDEALGEFGTQNRLGDVKFQSVPGAIPLIELRPYLDKLWQEKEWSDLSPLETYASYQAGEPAVGFPRADTIAGHTCLRVVFEFMNNEGPLDENPIEGTGAEMFYVQLDKVGAEHHADPLEYRNSVEEEIGRQLAGGGGYVTGAATGIENSYVDLIIFDGDRSIAAIKDAVGKTHLGDFEILPFYN